MRTRRLPQPPGGEVEGGRDDTEQEATKEGVGDATNEEQLWIVDAGEGQLHLVRGIGALRALMADRGLAKTARVYELSATSRTLGEVAELQSASESEPEADPTPAAEAAGDEPPVRTAEVVAEAGPAEPAGEASDAVRDAVRDQARDEVRDEARDEARDDEFALLDRPFDDGEYFEDAPLSRWVRPAGMVALVLVLGAGGYGVFHSRKHQAPPVAAAAAPTAAPAAVIPAAAPAPVAPPPPVTTLAVAPADPGPPEPAGSAAPAQPPVAAPGAPSRAYPRLVAEGERQFQEGHSKRAQALFEQALAETPEGTAALVGLGYVQLDRGRVPQAIALFERALVQDRNDPTALFGLAESHRQAGNRSAALDEFQRFLTLRSTGSDADIARRMVQELTSGG